MVEAVPLPAVLAVGVVVDDIAVVVDAEDVAEAGGIDGRRINLLRVWSPELEGGVNWGDGLGVRSVDGRRVSLRVCFADGKEGVGWGGTESDSADARLSSVNDPVCQMTVPLLIQYNPVTNTVTILKRLLRASKL